MNAFGENDMKTQMRVQKILMLVTLILSALTIVYAFSFCTGGMSYAFSARSGEFGAYPDDPINADALFDFVQPFNTMFIILCIVYLCTVALLYFFSCNSRRNYYITNYIAIGICVVYSLVFAIYSFIMIGIANGLFNNLDFDMFYELFISKTQYASEGVDNYSDSRAIFIIGYILFSLVVIDVAALVLNTIWKIKLMKGEKALLENGFQKEVA